ncbi:hypothetical protein [Ferruginibacter sp.]|nr:hypothetical protein [Ferruginibacter sp.]
MLKIDFTNEMIFSFEGPNLCLLGKPENFKSLGKIILELTDTQTEKAIDITEQIFIEVVGNQCKVIFSSKKGANFWGTLEKNNIVLFELDHRIWERIFQFSALLSWDMLTYYLNNYESGLDDLNLKQDCNIIWSSEF